MNSIAGLEDVTEAAFWSPITNVDLHKHRKNRDIAMVFQSLYALYPNMTVEQNISFVWKCVKCQKPGAKLKFSAFADMLQIDQLC